MNFGFLRDLEGKNSSIYNKVVVAGASCDYQKCKLCAVAGAKGFWVEELRVRQVKIGRKSCFALYHVESRWVVHFEMQQAIQW